MYDPYNNEDDIETFTLDKKIMINRSIVLYGASDTGKSAFITNILEALKDSMDQLYICAGNDECMRTYENIGFKPFMHKGFSTEFIKELWDRQEALTTVYRKVNKHVEELAYKIKDINTIRHLEFIKKTKQQKLKEIEEKYKNNVDKKEMELIECGELWDGFITLFCKKSINENQHKLVMQDLSETDAYTLKYLNCNPRCLLIIDDCVAQIQETKNKAILYSMFMEGRHKNITFVMALQDDKALISELRKNAFFSIFTTRQCATALFHRGSNSYSKDMKKKADNAIEKVFGKGDKDNAVNLDKLVFFRKTEKFYKCRAKKYTNIKFGVTNIMGLYSRFIQTNDDIVNKNNKYYKVFKQ